MQLDVRLSEKDISSFLFFHTYTSYSGIMSLAGGIIFLFLFFKTYGQAELFTSVIFALAAFVFIFYNPIGLAGKAKKQYKKLQARQPEDHYTFSDDGFTVEHNGQTLNFTWDKLYKVVQTRRLLIFYASRLSAIFIPRQAAGGDYDRLVEAVAAHVRIKKSVF